MLKIIMTREKIYRSAEFEIDPHDPEHVLNHEELTGNEEDNGFWNEYYRVAVVDTDKVERGMSINEQFSQNASDFYSYEDALDEYDKLENKLKKGEL